MTPSIHQAIEDAAQLAARHAPDRTQFQSLIVDHVREAHERAKALSDQALADWTEWLNKYQDFVRRSPVHSLRLRVDPCPLNPPLSNTVCRWYPLPLAEVVEDPDKNSAPWRTLCPNPLHLSPPHFTGVVSLAGTLWPSARLAEAHDIGGTSATTANLARAELLELLRSLAPTGDVVFFQRATVEDAPDEYRGTDGTFNPDALPLIYVSHVVELSGRWLEVGTRELGKLVTKPLQSWASKWEVRLRRFCNLEPMVVNGMIEFNTFQSEAHAAIAADADPFWRDREDDVVAAEGRPYSDGRIYTTTADSRSRHKNPRATKVEKWPLQEIARHYGDKLKPIIDGMTAKQQRFVLRHYADGLTQDEVAVEFGVNRQAVNDTLSRVRAEFKAAGLPEPKFSPQRHRPLPDNSEDPRRA